MDLWFKMCKKSSPVLVHKQKLRKMVSTLHFVCGSPYPVMFLLIMSACFSILVVLAFFAFDVNFTGALECSQIPSYLNILSELMHIPSDAGFMEWGNLHYKKKSVWKSAVMLVGVLIFLKLLLQMNMGTSLL